MVKNTAFSFMLLALIKGVNMKKIVKIVIFILVVALLVIGGVRLIKKRKAAEAKTPVANEYAVIVKTMHPKAGSVKLTLPAIALAGSDSNAMVASKVAGRILYAKKAGDIVKAGETLVKIDASSLKASLQSVEHSINSAKVALSNAISVHKTTAKLLRVGGATKEQFDAEQVKIDSLKAKIASLKSKKATILDNLSYATVKAPSDAIVAKSMVTAGDLAMPGKPLMQLTTKSKSYLLVRIPQNAKSVIFEGKEYALNPLNSTFNGLKEFRANIDKALPSGEREDVAVVNFKGQGTKLPLDTLLNRDGKSYVLAIKGKKVTPIEVKIIASGQEGVVVSNNLDGKEIAVAKPDILLRLISGYPVIVKNAK